uniref:CSON004645 protein n=1 Tax=Culicoides sonorensis TaxID=179676 RepID=A0A336KLD4_CULSO
MAEGDISPASSSQSTLAHSNFAGSDCEILDENIIIAEISEIEPTAAILRYCKRKFHRPYVAILSFAGLKPMTIDSDWYSWLGHIQTFFILSFLILGYVLQFVTGFRRDRGFVAEVPSQYNDISEDFYYYQYRKYFETGEIVFTYIIPSLLHLSGFLAAIYVYRIADNELLQSLIERVFILSTSPKKLVVNFWIYKTIALIWLILSVAYITFIGMEQDGIAKNHYIKLPNIADTQGTLKAILYFCLLFHDLVQVVIVSSYSILCLLLRCYLNLLKEKLLMHSIEPLEWMREICEFRKHLHHLNCRIAIPVSLFTLLNLSYCFSSIIHLFKDMNTCPVKIFSMSLANISLWMILALVPFFQAAGLTVTCRSTQSCGHLISIRPFVHRNTSSEELNTILLYASSLKMTAKLFRVPIISHYVCFILLICIIVVLTFGMCINLSIGIF